MPPKLPKLSLFLTQLFPSNPPSSPLETQYRKSRAALAAGEETGRSGEDVVERLFEAANIRYCTDIPSRTVWLPDEIRTIAETFERCISDGFVPQYRLHVEVKSGQGKETDSIDTKIYSAGLQFILLGWGDEPRPLSVLDEAWTPLHRLIVFVGKKQYSGYQRLLREFTRQSRTGEQPLTLAQQERAHRLHFANAEDLTPRWLDELRSEIDRYNASLM